MKSKHFNRLLSMLLVVATLFGLLAVPASAASLGDSGTVTIQQAGFGNYLSRSSGGTIGGGYWRYTSNDGLTGAAYCVNHGLKGVSPSKALTVQEYNRNPQTMGVFASGYPNRTLEQFKELHQDDVRGVNALTEDEYKYATQAAVWASCGQLAVPGTSFTAGRETLAVPTADAQKIRIFDSVKAMLNLSQHWTKNLYTGMSIRAEESQDVRGVEVVNEFGLEGAAASGEDGIKKETINGKQYYTRVMYLASATSTWIDERKTKVYSNDAPQGTIFVAENNSPLETVQENGATCYLVDTSRQHNTNLNSNGSEYYGTFKVCLPVDNVPDEGSFTIKATGGVAQYNLYLAYNPSASEQSYIISDPGYTTLDASASFKWSGMDDLPETASLQVVKAGAGGSPLEGAEFTLTGDKGTTVSGTTDRNGQIIWKDLPADEKFTLSETAAPEGYQIIAPMNVTLTAGRTSYVTVTDETEKGFTIKKVDAQNKGSLQGAVFRFEQIDGSYMTTGTTGFDGTISFEGAELPYGSYRITEQSPPDGYVKSSRVETVEWDGTKDVLITWENVRDISLTIIKVDEQTGVSLPEATFDVYADGKLITSVTTNDSGVARVTGIKKEAYIEVVETAAPAGYVLDRTPHGIHIDPYDPATEDDPVLTVTNRARPALRILKYDLTSNSPMPDVTFEVWHDGDLFGEYTTNASGEIFLYDLNPGTYLVKEVATDDAHVVNSTPQQIELKAGDTQTRELVFFNSLKPGIHLIKVDSITMKSLPNVRFEFKLVGGSYRQEFVTDINGEIDLSKLDPGAYEVRELEAPDGYLIDDAVRVVQINPDENANFVFTNTPKPALRLIKTSSDGSRLGGVHFRIAKIEDGSHYLDRITDDNGEINIDKLDPGVYSVKETATTFDHILDVREYHVELFPGQTSTITIENQRRSNLTIRKTDKDTGDPIPGVTFTLNFADGHTITTEPTGPDGTVTVENLLPGVYTITEQNVPEGYILDTTPQQVTLLPNRNASVQFQNYKRPTLTISKVDINGRFLTGAIFEVKTKAGVKIGDFPVGADGKVTIPNIHLTEGYYIITEIQAPKGYILDKTPHEVYLRPGKTTEISIENEKKPGLTIIKIDSVVGDGVKGAKFELWVSKDKTENGTYQKLNDTFYYTDENGIIELPELDTGWYKVKEVEPPEGYMLKEPSEQTLYVEHDKGSTITFENIPKSALVIRKIDADTGAPLVNAWFRVRYLGGTSGSGGTIIGEFNTSSNGNIIITGLEAGTYICEEINAPNGYVIDTAPQTAYISGKQQDCITLTFTNSKYGSLLVKKVDSVTGDPLSDVQFFITTSDGAVVGNSNGYFTTDSAGTILIPDIQPGTTLVVKETRAKAGYALDDTPQTVKIVSNETMTLEFRNQPLGSLLVRKVCSVNPSVTLQNAEFKITYADGTLVGDSNGVYRTDEAGEIRITGLIPGKSVIVTETRAPSGFILDTQSQTAQIKEGVTVSLTFKNQPKGAIIVQKRDSATGQPLSGAEFRVTTAAGCEVGLDGVIGSSTLTQNGIFTTDAQGEIRISNLAPGAYVLNEIKAPNGYVIDTPSTNVVIGSGGDTQTVIVKNSRAGTLLIEKKDSLTNKPLKGVTFKVTTAAGEFVPDESGRISSNGLYNTDANGQIKISGVVGTLVVTEVKTLPGYVIDEASRSQTVVVYPNDTQKLTFYNTPGTTLVIQKFIAGTDNEPLKGVKFLVTDDNGSPVGPSNGEYVTDANGRITINDLTPGSTVTAREVQTVEGYVLDGSPKSIKIKEGEVQTLTFTNRKAGTLVILKKDSVSGALIPGAQFQLTYADGGFVDADNGHLSSNGLYTTDDKGEIRISGLVGTIVAKELKAAPGYIMDASTQTQTVTVNPEDTQTLTFLNEPLASLTITKLDSVTGKPVPNTSFVVKDGNGNVLARCTTGKDGTATVTGLVPGSTVVVSEVSVPSGYVLDTKPKTIIVKNGANTLTGSTGTVTNPGTTPGGSTGDGNDLTFENDPKQTLTIHKYIEGTANEPLAGVCFKVVDGNGAPVGPGDGTFYTDAKGEIVIEGLEPGSTITAQEVKTVEGFVLDGTPKSVKIKAGQGAPSLTFWNKRAGELIIRKLDKATGKPLAGVEFELTYAGGGYVDNANGHLSSNGLYITDAHGEIHISGVTGTIVVKETRTIEGYTIDPATQTQTVKVNPQDTQALTFYNAPKQTLTIQKYVDGTTDPIQGVTFLITDSSGQVVGPNNGEYVTDRNGRIVLTDLVPGTTITAKEVKTVSGYVLDTTPQSILIKSGIAQTLTFFNKSEGGLELIKVSESDPTRRIPGTTFEIRKMDGALVETVTTGKDGRVHVNLDAGSYYALEIEAAQGFKLDATHHDFTVQDGKTTTLTVKNKPFSGILIHKTDSATGKGIYGVSFLLYDASNTPIGQYTSDNSGYVYIEGLTTSGRYYLRELENEGYIVDTQMKTVYVTAGETTLVEWKNTPITAQIQIIKKSADYNPTNGLPEGTLLSGAVFEIYDKANNVVDTIKSDSRGLAVSKPLPLGRYTIKEVKAPDNYGVNDSVLNAYLEHKGQILTFEVTNKSLTTGVSITKTGPKEVMGGQPVRYMFSGIANTSNVRLDSFYWRDTLPAEVILDKVVTGTYNYPGNYKIVYRVNGGEYQTLADNLSTHKNYTLAASPVALGLASNERVTEIMFVFGQAPAGFAQVEKPYIYCNARPGLPAGSFVNKADVGGVYNGEWIQAVSRWVTTIYGKKTTLPRTGY